MPILETNWKKFLDSFHKKKPMLASQLGMVGIGDLPGGVGNFRGHARIREQALHLEAETRNMGVQSFHIVCHSQGGLVSRYMIEHLHRGGIARVPRLVALATPHHGSGFAKSADGILQILDKLFSTIKDDLIEVAVEVQEANNESDK